MIWLHLTGKKCGYPYESVGDEVFQEFWQAMLDAGISENYLLDTYKEELSFKHGVRCHERKLKKGGTTMVRRHSRCRAPKNAYYNIDGELIPREPY